MFSCLEPELVLPGDLSLTKEAAPREGAEEEGHDSVGGGTQEALHHLRRRCRCGLRLVYLFFAACVDARHRMTVGTTSRRAFILSRSTLSLTPLSYSLSLSL